MEENNLIKPEKISLQNYPILNEKWLQEIIAKDPSILGLGDLILKDKERIQPKAGRLDLLLQDPEISRRYEVEIQLGKVDESHIIRTVEYWDIERKRYPQYDHCAVIIAEDITSRFLNIINLFNSSIPLIAIQMNAYKIEGKYFLIFTNILDEVNLGISDDEEEKEVADRNYWETVRATKETVAMADQLLGLIKEFAPEVELKYNKFYIGLAKGGRPNNFAAFIPRRINSLKLEIKLDKSDEIDKQLEEAGLDVMDYDPRWMQYRIRLTKEDLEKNQELLSRLLKAAHLKSGI